MMVLQLILGYSSKIIPNRKSHKTPRGIVILDSCSTGLLGGKERGLVINGKFSMFDWDKAMLLTKLRKH